jgi:hypothetical protein
MSDYHIPELMLQDDGHFFGILLLEPARNGNAGPMGIESNVQMMLAWQSRPANLLQNGAHNTAQRILRHYVVSDLILSHCPLPTQFTQPA